MRLRASLGYRSPLHFDSSRHSPTTTYSRGEAKNYIPAFDNAAEEGSAIRLCERKRRILVHVVCDKIQRCAYESNIDLTILDNRYSAAHAVRNAQQLVAEKVDLAIEPQAYNDAAADVAAVFANAGIPPIAIEIPHPGAHFYGANNCRAGWILYPNDRLVSIDSSDSPLLSSF